MGPGISLGTGLDLSVDPPPSSAALPPRLLSIRLAVTPGLLRAGTVPPVYWSHLGKLRISSWDLTTGTRKGISSYVPATPATEYWSGLTSTGLTIGNQYRLDYWLDCIPDVAGYVEQWYETGIFWTQPSSTDDPISISWSQP